MISHPSEWYENYRVGADTTSHADYTTQTTDTDCKAAYIHIASGKATL